MENKSINSILRLNEEYLKNTIGESFDTKYRNLEIPAFDFSKALIVYISGLIDARIVDDTIIEPLMKFSSLPSNISTLSSTDYSSIIMKQCIFTTDVKETTIMDEICDAIMEGDSALFLDNAPSALILSTRNYEGRSVDEPNIESEIKGPRDGFVENIQTNVSLIRRRIKDYGLRFDTIKLGNKTKTVISIAYISGLADDALIKEVKSRFEKINTDAVFGSEYLDEMIKDSPYSIFPTIANTERPDKVCASLLEGRIAVLTDNTPLVLTMPVVFWQFLASSGDYYDNFYVTTFIRWIRLIALFFCLSASSIYVLLTSFHQEMLPTALALKIAASRMGVPFPSVIEAGGMAIVLEIMKEAGLRLPKPMGQAVSIVGTLVIGQAAVSAGLVSPMLVIIIAVEAISSFAIPSFSMSNTLRLLRFPILISTAFFGLLGYLAGIITIMLHLMSIRSFGSPYLAPVIPFDKNGMKDIFIRAPWWKMLQRPKFTKSKDSTRQNSNFKNNPPS